MMGFFKKIKKTNLRYCYTNLVFFLTNDIQKEIIKEKNRTIKELKFLLNNHELDLLYLKILDYFNNNSNVNNYKEEIAFLRENGRINVYPYKCVENNNLKIISGKDLEKGGMPYVLHNDKRLYFPIEWTEEQAVEKYKILIDTENILGINSRNKSPHQYVTNDFKVNTGDVLLDLGAAEGLFALNYVDIAAKIYIFEPLTFWREPLLATFEPYKEKVEIVNKYVSNIDDEYNVKLGSWIAKINNDSVFIKMDIEGFETKVLKDNLEFFKNLKGLKISCCTYHKHDDDVICENLLKEIGLKTCFSDGYMLFIYDELKPPYFRKGILRGY